MTYIIGINVIELITLLLCYWKFVYKAKEDKILEDILLEEDPYFYFDRCKFNRKYRDIENKYKFLIYYHILKLKTVKFKIIMLKK